MKEIFNIMLREARKDPTPENLINLGREVLRLDTQQKNHEDCYIFCSYNVVVNEADYEWLRDNATLQAGEQGVTHYVEPYDLSETEFAISLGHEDYQKYESTIPNTLLKYFNNAIDNSASLIHFYILIDGD